MGGAGETVQCRVGVQGRLRSVQLWGNHTAAGELLLLWLWFQLQPRARAAASPGLGSGLELDLLQLSGHGWSH